MTHRQQENEAFSMKFSKGK